jgi:hypothetical protein
MYPKTFFAASELITRPGTCFVVMPFAAEFDAVFHCIKDALEGELRLGCIRTKDLLGGGDIIEDILRGLATSELVVADVTGRNPNVFYELGIAHMCKPVEKVLLLSQEIDAIPFDLRHFRYIVYTATTPGLEVLCSTLREAVGAVIESHRIILDSKHQGALSYKLMGKDRCLYDFEVKDAALGYDAARVSLVVTRYVMTDRLESTVVFTGGLGLNIDAPCSIGDTEWTISLTRSPDGTDCFLIRSADR